LLQRIFVGHIGPSTIRGRINDSELIMTKIVKMVAVVGLAALSVVGANAMTGAAKQGGAHWTINAGQNR